MKRMPGVLFQQSTVVANLMQFKHAVHGLFRLYFKMRQFKVIAGVSGIFEVISLFSINRAKR